MAEDSEKRFHSIMDKLFHSPRSVSKASSSSSSSQAMQSLRGKKRLNPTSALALVDSRSGTEKSEGTSAGMSETPVCRPWDRGDLMRRLSTFKSMTWFAKPKVVSAVNCARRGWVNVETDTIACEACGARLLFSTSSSWSREQVEKVALVFSLKLDSGHKLLCPWIDNACDETLAHFPPSEPLVLADEFRERSSILAHLTALPIISSSAIEFMRSPQLDQFLQQPSMLDHHDASLETPMAEYRENGWDTDSANLYYQALKLISLCGWEPRILPYMVDPKMDLSSRTAEREKSIVCTLSADHRSMTEANGNSSESIADPKSVVLDCKLCGASVGLWAFVTVPRPLEVFRFVGLTGSNNGKSSTHDTANGIHSNRISSMGSNAPSSNLNMTIAGGPPPAQQNFRATISLPVIGRSIWARFSSDANLRSHLLVNQEDNQSELRITSVSSGEESNKTIKNTADNEPPADCRDGRTEDSGNLMEGTEGTSSVDPNNISGEATTGNDAEGTSQSNNMPKNARDTGSASVDVDARSPLKDSNEKDAVIADKAYATSKVVNSGQELPSNSTTIEESPVLHDSSKGGSSSDAQRSSGSQENEQSGHNIGAITPVSSKKELLGKHTRLKPADKAMEFDPVRQHRHFCPWIESNSGVVPGWQQVLSALQRRKEGSHVSPTSSPSASLIKVDDPITSVRRLFMSKRMKSSKGSS